jgi:hypothetical protein
VRFQRTRYIPKDSIEVNHPQGLGVAYVHRFTGLNGTRYNVIAYGGKRTHSDFHYSYKTIEAAHDKIEQWFSGLQQHVELLQKYRAERQKPHTFTVGDIVTNSWGYDQTNVDWYRVAKTTAHFVWLQPIAAQVEETGFMSGQSAPSIDTSSDDPTQWGFHDLKQPVQKHAASGSNVSMKYGSGSKWNGERRYASWYA